MAEFETVLADVGTRLTVVPGGDSRRDSVAAALKALPPDVDIVLVHDAARCLTPAEIFKAVTAAVAQGAGAVVPVVPVSDTIKQIRDERVIATPERSTLRAVQTPQGFRRVVLERAHSVAPGAGGEVTDDAGMAESIGCPVVVVPGHDEAFKITQPLDLVLAEAVVRRRAGHTS